MIVAFTVILWHNTRFLQQILLDLGTLDDSIGAKVYIDVLAKTKEAEEFSQNKILYIFFANSPRWIVIAYRFGITKGLQYGIRFQDLLLDPRVFAAYGGQIL